MVERSNPGQDEHDRLLRMLPEVKAELKARYRDVVDVGISLKHRGGDFTDEFCFRVFVKEKKSPDKVAKDQVIPETVRGVKTDVWNELKLKRLDDQSAYRPLIGGTKVTVLSSGTMGCVATLTGGPNTGKPVLLSNHHVLYGNGAKKGDRVGQATVSNCGCCSCCGVATNEDASEANDCAIALLDGDVRFTNEIHEIGLVAGTGTAQIHTPANPFIVRKRGMRTELTQGRVTMLTAPDVLGGVARSDLIEITPATGKFAFYGDSGSVVVDSENRVVGLLYSIDAATETLGFAIPIASVTGALNISIERSGTAAAIPIGSAVVSPGNAIVVTAPPGLSNRDTSRLFEEFGEGLEQTMEGRRALALWDTHFAEIMHLVNNDREVKLAWNRFRGPAFIAHFIKSGKDPDHRVPEEIDGIALNNLLLRMTVVLQKQGSAQLAADVRTHHQTVFRMLHQCTGLPRLVERLKTLSGELT